ncbi:MAG: vitamin K epoxide reductase family protein [Candidatus Spechtbacterales bacterium]
MVVGASGFFFAVLHPGRLGFYAFIAAAALAGFGVSYYIYRTKKGGGMLVCPSGSDCNAVVSSKYSKFMSIKLEYLGMFYFATIFFSYILLIFAYELLPWWAVALIVLLTMAAAGMSSYLLFVQAVLLRKFCIWCLLVAFLSLSIFIASLISIDRVLEILIDIQPLLNAIASLGFILGMGGTVAAVFLFFKFLQDFRIGDDEMSVIKNIAELIWTGFALLLISQLAVYVSNSQVLSQDGVFLTKMTSILIMGVSGAIIMVIFAPLFSMVPFGEEKKKESQEHSSLLGAMRKPIFVMGAIALGSWFFAFFAHHITANYSLLKMLFIYALVLAISIIFAFLIERQIREISTHTTNGAE